MNILENLKYTEEHEWVRVEGNIAYVGITDFAQSELGEIVFVELEHLEESLDKGEIFGSIEAVKTVSDLFMPLTGKIIEINEQLEDAPELVNSDAFGEGWMIKIEFSDASELTELMDASAYKALVD